MDMEAKLLELGYNFDSVEPPPDIMAERKQGWNKLFQKFDKEFDGEEFDLTDLKEMKNDRKLRTNLTSGTHLYRSENYRRYIAAQSDIALEIATQYGSMEPGEGEEDIGEEEETDDSEEEPEFSTVSIPRQGAETPTSRDNSENILGLKSTGLTPTLRRAALSPISGARSVGQGLSSSVSSPRRFILAEKPPVTSTPTLRNPLPDGSFQDISYLPLSSPEPEPSLDPTLDILSLPNSDDEVNAFSKSPESMKGTSPYSTPSRRDSSCLSDASSRTDLDQSSTRFKPYPAKSNPTLLKDSILRSNLSPHKPRPTTAEKSPNPCPDSSCSLTPDEDLQACILCERKTRFPDSFIIPDYVKSEHLTLCCDICIASSMHKGCSCDDCVEKNDWMTYRWLLLDKYLAKKFSQKPFSS